MKIPSAISDNFELKLVSVVLASLLWLYVVAGKEGDISVQVPVVYANLADGLTIVRKPPDHIDLILRGNRLAIFSLNRAALCVTLDMSGVGEGTVSFSHLEKNVNIGTMLKVSRIYPAQVDVTLARINE